MDVPNGLLKGDGTTISAAVAGTDYVSPDGMNEAVATAKDVFWATLDSTYAEVKAAYDAGKIIKFGFMEGAKTILEMEHFDEDGVFWFRGVKPRTSNDEASGVYSLVRFKLSPNGSWAGLTTINLPSKAEVDSKLSLTGGTMTGAISFSGSQESETSKLFWKNGAFCLTTGQGNVPPFKLSSNDEEATLSFGPAITETGSSYYSSSISLKGNGVTISAPGGLVKITELAAPTADGEPVNLGYYNEGYSQLRKEINLNILTTYLVLAPNEWVENSKTGVYVCHHSCNNVKSDNGTQAIFVTYDPQVTGNRTAYLEANVQCVGQDDGTLYFECDTVPSKEIVVNVAILNCSFFEMEAE